MEKAKQIAHYYTFPKWSFEHKYLILILSFLSLAGGAGGAYLCHIKNPLAVYTWHFGVIAILICSVYFVKGTYQKYLAYAWDVYY